MISESAVPSEDVEKLAEKLKLKLFRTSVKENFNVDQGMYRLNVYITLPYYIVFEYLAHKYLHVRKKQTTEITGKQPSSTLGKKLALGCLPVYPSFNVIVEYRYDSL